MDEVRKHSYTIGDEVEVRLMDWDSKGQMYELQTKGFVLSQVQEPFGYNIQLSEQISFIGSFPAPIFSPKAQRPQVETYRARKSNRDAYDFNVIFCKEFMLTRASSDLRCALLDLIQDLIFKRVHISYSKPDGIIEYINVYLPDGKVKTLSDDKHIPEVLIGCTDIGQRLAYKVPHFFGFTKTDMIYDVSKSGALREKSIHFTSNKHSNIDFWDGFTWTDSREQARVYLPQEGNLLCGKASHFVTGKAPSFDKWFNSSEQFMRLCKLLQTYNPRQDLDPAPYIDALIIPVNETNHYVPHEYPLSRYFYAAVFMLAVLKMNKLPEAWRLPKKQNSITGLMEPFEEWWPNKILNH